MVLFSNEDSCGDVFNKQPLENGHIPKYKHRKVSVVRDFPPQCGPNFVPNNVKIGENGADAIEVVNPLEAEGGESFIKAKMMDVEGVNTSDMSKVDKICEIKVSGIGNVVDSRATKTFNIVVNSNMDVHEAESLDALLEKVAASANHVEKMLAGIGLPEIELRNEVDGQTHKSVNDPIQVKRSEHEDGLMEQVATTKDGLLNNAVKLITETSPIGVDLPNNVESNSTKSGGQTMSKGIKEVEGLSLIQNPGMEEAEYLFDAGASTRLMDKYRHRRVSAVRDLPPNCGINIKLPPVSVVRDLPPNCGTNIKLPPVSVVRDLPPNCGTNIKLPPMSAIRDLPPNCGTNIKSPVSAVRDLPPNCGTNVKLPHVRDLPPNCGTNIKSPMFVVHDLSPNCETNIKLPPVSVVRDLPPNCGTNVKLPPVSVVRDLSPNYGTNIKLPDRDLPPSCGTNIKSPVRDLPPNFGTNIKLPPVSVVRDLPPNCRKNVKLPPVSVVCDLPPNCGTNIKLLVCVVRDPPPNCKTNIKLSVRDLPPNCGTNIKLPVSVVRDRPPNCGTDIKLSTKEEKHVGVLGGDCRNNSEQVKVKPQSTMWGNGSGQALGETLVTSSKECRDEIDEVRVHKETTERLNDDAGRGPLKKSLSGNIGTIASQEIMEATVEGGLIDFEECNTGLEESSIKKNEAKQSLPGLGATTKCMVNNGSKDTGGRVGKETVKNSADRNDEVRARCRNSSSGNVLRREVVHGLMAAPYCPWRKGKSRGNMKQEKRKRKPEAECLGQLSKKKTMTHLASY